jgi:CPA1 family monovalent cation:H+ antiporter
VLTWGGLRGGISVALALSLPPHDEHRSAIVATTYMVVVFSVFAQGLTIGPLIRRVTVAPASIPNAH